MESALVADAFVREAVLKEFFSREVLEIRETDQEAGPRFRGRLVA
jgi:hypothetical protein